jgi:serine/threonine protein kinase
MLLNPYNCFQIDEVGIYVYFHELNRLFFYEQKKDKDFIFNPDKIESKDNEIIFTSNKNIKLYLQPFFELKQFEQYFIKSITKKSNKPDFFLMNKFTKKRLATSEIEPRIVYFDWTKQLIRYYGPDNRGIKVYDVIVPNPIPLKKDKSDTSKYIYMINEESYAGLLDKHSDNIQFKKFLFQIFYLNDTNPLQNPSNPSESNPELDQYLKEMGFLTQDQSSTYLFDSINSTELKKDWKEYLIEKLTHSPLPFMHDNYEKHHISLDGYIQHELSGTNSYYKLKDTIDQTPLTHIFVKINGNLHRIDITKEDLIGESKKCGADNCFKTITVAGKTYGVRFSKNILFDRSILLYDTIIEMLINCISYFTLQKLKEGQRMHIADIQSLSGIGFYRVNIKDTKTIAYIPYTVYEMTEETITLYDLLKNILNGDPSIYTVDKIKEILGKVCLQIYNFYNIMYPSIKFEHNDFKIDNIVLNQDTLQVYIIDFGLARINVITKNRNYQIFKREVKELERKDAVSNFYFYISDIYQKYYLNKQADIEKLTVWLKDIPSIRHFPNQANYKTVVQSSLIPHIKFLEYLSLKDIETSDKISYYKELELKDQLPFSACQDLFLYTMYEFKQAIDSFLNNPLSKNDSQSSCMSIINSKLSSSSPSPPSSSPSSSQLSSASSTSSKSLNRRALVRKALENATKAEANAASVVGGARKTRKLKHKNKTKKNKNKTKTKPKKN